MSITFSGLATGLDTDSIVTDIMALERAPLERIEARKGDETKRLEAYKQFESKLDGLKSAVGDMNITSQIRSTSISLSSEDSFSAATTSAPLGSYSISIAQLSQVQKTVASGFSSNSDSILGTGTITVNGTEISVTDENNSLLGLVESINELSETTGVSVSIINDGSDENPYHMVFTGQDADTSFTISSDLVDATDSVINFDATEAQAAQQAVAFIDGIKVVSTTNSITDAINGVTLNLNSVSAVSSDGTPEEGVKPWDWVDPPTYNADRMDIKADTGALKEKITTFVTAYNDVMDWILSGYEEFGSTSEIATDSEEKEEALLGSVLRGDSTINSMKRQLQNMLTETVDNGGAFNILTEIGISTNLNGTLRQDNGKLDAALENNFDDMVLLLSGDDDSKGVMKGFNSLLLNMTSSADGVYAVKKNAYLSAVDRFDTQIDHMELRLSKREDILRSQFSMMEQLVSSLNAQGDFLTQQMDALNRD